MLLDEADTNPYLQQEVLSASPARLRWMLIARAAELCGFVDQLWSNGQVALGNQWLLRIREILGELLDGVKDSQNPLSTPICDFYLFLLQVTLEVDKHQDRERLKVLAELLAIEAETWRLVVDKAARDASSSSPADSLFPSLSSSLDTSLSGFSLEV
ncbi:MAG: flagellar protein FliS [Pirellulaceae bacterium]|nr:flagellar protein FliS [Pirellulaceae bacterium]